MRNDVKITTNMSKSGACASRKIQSAILQLMDEIRGWGLSGIYMERFLTNRELCWTTVRVGSK